MMNLIVTHNAGFFSCCTIRLKEIIDFYNLHKILPKVDSSVQWHVYKDENIDITNRFFQDKKSDITNYIFESTNFTYSSDEEQFSDYSLINYTNISLFINDYFTPSLEVEEIQQKLIEKYNIDTNKCIGVLFRGNDKSKETNIPSYDDFLSKITEIKTLYPDYKIILQSDEKELYDLILDKYPDTITFDEIEKINRDSNSSVPNIVIEGKKTEQACIFLAILLLLSKTNKLIFNSGNVAMWCCLYRNNINGTYQYLSPKEYIYEVRNPNFRQLETYWLNHD